MKGRNTATFIMLVAGFLLFWEWLRPLEQVTDTGGSYLFVIFTVICFLTSYFIKNGLGTFLIKFIAMLLILDYLFMDARLFSGPWLQQLQMELTFNIDLIWQNNWIMMTSFFRSLLFLVVLWLMSYLLHYWFTISNKFFLFVVLTIIYLAVLDTFTVYDAQMAMIRTFIVSFVVLGLNRYLKLMEQSEQKSDQRNLWQWMAFIIGVVAFATIAGIYAPKLEPQWPDPVPFIQSNADHIGFGSGGSVQQVGYGEDDSQLGGSFMQDDSLVFEAVAHDNVYWRIESKDVYTGKGWETSTDLNYELIEDGQVDFETFSAQQVDVERHSATVRPDPNNPLPRVVYPYGIAQLTSNNPEAFFIDRDYGVIESESSEQSMNNGYIIDYDAPSFSVNDLQQSSENDEAAIRERYLQLPDELPERIGDLAAEITAESDNRYDKAKAVERYFAANGFRYQTTDIPVPEGNTDYVDQFLFETQVGYCDNYSTSMVVMLRTLDIPARWVKGFTGGTEALEQPPLPDNYSLYEITNNNAHSWVEVYFPETGWVAFEPTSGFSNPTDFYYEATEDSAIEQELDEQTNPNPEEEQQETDQETEEEEETAQDHAAAGGNQEQGGWGGMLYLWLAVGLIVMILGIIAYLKRHQIQNWYAIRRWQRLLDKAEMEKAYLYLLKCLDRKGYPRETGQTLRKYAKEVDQQLEATEMSEITSIYEEYLYHNQTSDVSEQKRLQNLFKQLGHRIFT